MDGVTGSVGKSVVMAKEDGAVKFKIPSWLLNEPSWGNDFKLPKVEDKEDKIAFWKIAIKK